MIGNHLAPLKKLLPFLLLGLLSLPTTAQTNYYVQAAGNDAPGAGSFANPFATLDYAADQLAPGDTLNVRAGTYANLDYQDGDYWKDEKTWSINNLHGTAAAWITLRPYAPEADEVVLRGDGQYIVQIRNSSYVHLTGFRIEGETENISLALAEEYQFAYRLTENGPIEYRFPPGTPPSEIEGVDNLPLLPDAIRPSYFNTRGLIAQLSDHIRITNCHIRMMPGTGLRANTCSYVWVEGNEIENCSRRSYTGTHGLVFEQTQNFDNSTGTKMWIRRNHVHHNYNELFSWNPNKTFVTPVIDEGKGISMQRNDASYGWTKGRIRIENNLCHHNGFSGVHSNNGRGIDIVNNTCVDNTVTQNGGNHGISLQRTTDARIFNNLSVTDFGNALSMTNSSDVTVRRNHAEGGLNANLDAIDEQTTFGDPGFVGTGAHPYQLGPDSPARDAAELATAAPVDYFDQPRDGMPDVGCYEFGSVVSTAELERTEQLQVFPNPTAGRVQITWSHLRPEAVSVYDARGRLVQQRVVETSAATADVDLSELPAGMYFLRVGRSVVRVVRW